MALQKFDDVFDVAQKCGQFEDKTFLAFFGAWKHKQTKEPLQFFYKYLQCPVEEGIQVVQCQRLFGAFEIGRRADPHASGRALRGVGSMGRFSA